MTVHLGNNTVETTAELEVVSTDSGVLISRMTTAQRDAISSPAESLLIFNTTTNHYEWYDADGSAWETLQNKGDTSTGTIRLTAGSASSPSVNGAASGTIETATHAVLIPTKDFDASTIEYVQWAFSMPDNWDASTITAVFKWSAASGSGDVRWGIQAEDLANDDAIDTAFGSAEIVTDTLTAAGDLCVTSATSAFTVSNSPAAGDLVVYRVYRDASNGNDTLAVDAQLIEVSLTYGITT